jgi:threonine/homoserine/homoserine lactone efflux protein
MLAFLLTSLLIELTPGPNMAYLATVALAEGRRPAMMAVAGVALGLAISGLAAALGLAALALSYPVLLQVLRYAGIAYLLWLAWDTWKQPAEGATDELASFRRGLITNLLNPKAFAFYVSVLPGFLPDGMTSAFPVTIVYVAVYVAVATAVHAGIVLAADALRPTLTASGRRLVIRRVLALGLVGVAVWFAWSTRMVTAG